MVQLEEVTPDDSDSASEYGNDHFWWAIWLDFSNMRAAGLRSSKSKVTEQNIIAKFDKSGSENHKI